MSQEHVSVSPEATTHEFLPPLPSVPTDHLSPVPLADEPVISTKEAWDAEAKRQIEDVLRSTAKGVCGVPYALIGTTDREGPQRPGTTLVARLTEAPTTKREALVAMIPVLAMLDGDPHQTKHVSEEHVKGIRDQVEDILGNKTNYLATLAWTKRMELSIFDERRDALMTLLESRLAEADEAGITTLDTKPLEVKTAEDVIIREAFANNSLVLVMHQLACRHPIPLRSVPGKPGIYWLARESAQECRLRLLDAQKAYQLKRDTAKIKRRAQGSQTLRVLEVIRAFERDHPNHGMGVGVVKRGDDTDGIAHMALGQARMPVVWTEAGDSVLPAIADVLRDMGDTAITNPELDENACLKWRADTYDKCYMAYDVARESLQGRVLDVVRTYQEQYKTFGTTVARTQDEPVPLVWVEAGPSVLPAIAHILGEAPEAVVEEPAQRPAPEFPEKPGVPDSESEPSTTTEPVRMGLWRWQAGAFGRVLKAFTVASKELAVQPDRADVLQQVLDKMSLDQTSMPLETPVLLDYLVHKTFGKYLNKKYWKDVGLHGVRRFDQQDIKSDIRVPSGAGEEYPSLTLSITLPNELAVGSSPPFASYTYQRLDGKLVKVQEASPANMSIAERSSWLAAQAIRFAVLVVHDSYIKHVVNKVCNEETAEVLDTQVFPVSKEEKKLETDPDTKGLSTKKFNRASVLEAQVLVCDGTRIDVYIRFLPLAYMPPPYGEFVQKEGRQAPWAPPGTAEEKKTPVEPDNLVQRMTQEATRQDDMAKYMLAKQAKDEQARTTLKVKPPVVHESV